MSVYVDNARIPFGRMRMCHMMADTTEELLAMVDRLGVSRAYLQHAGRPDEHFDICLSKRDLAIAWGALEVSGRDLVQLIRFRRAQRGGMQGQ